MRKFFKRLYDKTTKFFWTVATVILGVGVGILGIIVICFYAAKEVIVSQTKKRLKENDEIIKNGNKTTSNNDDYIKSMRKKYN